MKPRWTRLGLTRLGFALGLALCSSIAAAQTALRVPGGGRIRALVVGVDHYQHVNQLRGALADADDIAATLGRMGVSDITQLRDGDVTRAKMLASFELLLARARTNDLIFLSLAGHGAQEPEHITGSQPDGMDAIFILSGFDPATPEGSSEKILDTEFNHYIKLFEEKGARVLFVADTCSGGGLAREIDPRAEPLTYRAITYRPVGDRLTPVASRADSQLSPIDFKSSAFLAAVDKQSKAPEVKIPGVPGYRGALSYAVARAFEGAADVNGDGRITLPKLFAYVRQVTYQLTDQRQNIVTAAPERLDTGRTVLTELSRGISVRPLRPSGEAAPPPEPKPGPPINAAVAPPPLVLKPVEAAPPQPPKPAGPAADPVRLALLGADAGALAAMPASTPFELVTPRADPDLVWDAAKRQALARGDIIADNIGLADLPGVIERVAGLRAIKLRAAAAPQAVRILPNDALHHAGEKVEVRIDNLKGRTLVLFNLAGDGTVQQLYPAKPDAPPWSEPTYSMQFKVTGPFGGDQLVAVTSAGPMPELDRAIRSLDKRRSPLKAADMIRQWAPTDALVGTVGLYTGP